MQENLKIMMLKPYLINFDWWSFINNFSLCTYYVYNWLKWAMKNLTEKEKWEIIWWIKNNCSNNFWELYDYKNNNYYYLNLSTFNDILFKNKNLIKDGPDKTYLSDIFL